MAWSIVVGSARHRHIRISCPSLMLFIDTAAPSLTFFMVNPTATAEGDNDRDASPASPVCSVADSSALTRTRGAPCSGHQSARVLGFKVQGSGIRLKGSGFTSPPHTHSHHHVT